MQPILAARKGMYDESLSESSSINRKPDGISPEGNPEWTKIKEQAIEDWLRHFGFHFNPFQATDAERDEHLATYFVEHPDFDNLARLENRLIFARAGDGKTVLRLRLQSFYREELLRKKVFCFSYTIPLTVAANPPSDIASHLPHILKASVRHAFVLLATHGNDLANLQSDPAIASAFAAYFDRYLGTSFWLDDLRDALATNSVDPIIQNLKSTFDDLDLPSGWLTLNSLWLRHWLELLPDVTDRSLLAADDITQWPDLLPNATDRLPVAGDDTAQWQVWQTWQELLRRAGFRASLLLIDGIDVKPSAKEASGVQASPDLMQRMAMPLVREMQENWFGEHTFVKLFLPIEIFILLSDTLHVNDPIAILHWSREELGQLLATRLQAATYGAITDFSQLVEPDVHPQFTEWLLTVAGFSPRYLLHAIDLILRVHVGQSNPGKAAGKISCSTLAKFPFAYPQPY